MKSFDYSRRATSAVAVGKIIVGGDAPIRIQSMANTDTNDIEASVAQAERIAVAGGELVRFTTQGVREAQSLGAIRAELRQRGNAVPLVADVHFNANVANVAAELVEKVRINPGNFVAGKQGGYSDEDFAVELEKIRFKLHELIAICKAHHTALRIGVNHGSLSPRIMSRYGDTPEGLAASCMEFLRLCEADDFHDIVLSVKASNTLVMVQAVRLLVSQMEAENMRYPLHLGVTEAGEGEDGRIKSAVGIGALLADGIGDTVRVSLSEAPECEIPVASALVEYITARNGHAYLPKMENITDLHAPRTSLRYENVGGGQAPVVCGRPDAGADFDSAKPLPRFCWDDIVREGTQIFKKYADNQVFMLVANGINPVGEWRYLLAAMAHEGCQNPVIIARNYDDERLDALQLHAAADFGVMLLDKQVDGICIEAAHLADDSQLVPTAFAILQAARARFTKTEYISCPSCGRTMFDLPKTVAEIKAATAQYKNLKIAVMGCIVNGPGEMADADYGYVGAGKGRVSLYRKKECVAKNIPAEEAVERLLTLIESTKS